MKVILTEETIRKALHESIDEMILEEELLQEWGESFKKAWNGVKNAAAMYMDWRTKGQWNNKYGIYANGTGKTTEMYYLNKWFNWHVKQIQQLEYRNQNPSDNTHRQRKVEVDPNTGRETYIKDEYDDQTIQEYAERNITEKNFNDWIGRRVRNRQALGIIDKYITSCQQQIIKSPYAETAINCLNTAAFMSACGDEYFKSTQQDRQQYQTDKTKNDVNDLRQNLQQEATYVDNFFNQLQTFLKSYKDNVEYFMDYTFDGYFTKYFDKYLNSGNKNTTQRINLVKNYVDRIWSVWKQTLKNNPNKLNQFINQINYKVFLKNEQGKRYWYLQRQMGVYGNN